MTNTDRFDGDDETCRVMRQQSKKVQWQAIAIEETFPGGKFTIEEAGSDEFYCFFTEDGDGPRHEGSGETPAKAMVDLLDTMWAHHKNLADKVSFLAGSIRGDMVKEAKDD
jgi:hypothetical protein